MRLAIFSAGSQGDFLPCLRLGRALQRSAYRVTIAAPENFASQLEHTDLDFHPLHGDVQQIMAGDTGRKLMGQANANPIQTMLAMRKMIGPIAIQMAQDGLEACRGADALLSLAVFAPIARSLADIAGIPLMLLEPTPMLPTRLFPAPGWPVQRSQGGIINRFSGHAMLRLIWLWYAPFVNDFRRQHGLLALPGSAFYNILSTTPLLCAYSPAVIPPPADWPATAHLTGYWFDEPASYQPGAELESFLLAGPPPVYIGFGSMTGSDPAAQAALALDALAQSGQRGVLLTGWGGLDPSAVPESVHVIASAPHAWLFPRMAAVVHHGGAGTTAEGLRAGVPQVIVPHIVDQPFWAQRLLDLGVSPAPVPAKQLSAAALAHAILQALDPARRARAAGLGHTIRSEDGLANAVQVVQQNSGA